MQKTTVGSLLSTVSSAASTSDGEDRAQIGDLQSRYRSPAW